MSNSSIDQKVKTELVRKEVIQCVSYLVSDLYKNEEYQDELSEIMSKTDYETPVDWYIENEMTTKEAWEYIDGEIMEHCYGNAKKHLQNWVDEDDENQIKFADDNGIDPEYIEAYEHYLVTDWFGKKLADKGEMVIEFKGLTIWGRSCSGQAVMMDKVIDDIANDMGILEGQENHKYWVEA